MSTRSPGRRGPWRRVADLVIGLSGVAVFLLIWQVVAVLKDDPIVLVTPLKVGQTAWKTVRTSEYWLHWRVSLWEYAIGMTLAVTSGVLGGAILGQVAVLKRAVDPVLTAFYSTPTVALAPLFILWFGLGTLSKVMVVWYVAFLPIVVISATGIANVDPAYLDVARVFRTSRARTVFSVLLPAAMPSVIAGIRVGSGVGLIGIILGEFFGSEAGLGYLVLYATNRFDLALLLVGVLSLALVGIVIAGLLTLLERRWSG